MPWIGGGRIEAGWWKFKSNTLHKNKPRRSIRIHEESSLVLVLRSRFAGFCITGPSRADAGKLHTRRRRSSVWWIPSAARLASCCCGLVHTADHRSLFGDVQPRSYGCGVCGGLCTNCAENFSSKESHSLPRRWVRDRRIGPVFYLDQYSRLAAGNRVRTGREWITGFVECWCAILAKCDRRRCSLLWGTFYRLGHCRTHRQFPSFVETSQSHSSRRNSFLDHLKILRPRVGHVAWGKNLSSMWSNHSMAKKMGQELGPSQMVL